MKATAKVRWSIVLTLTCMMVVGVLVTMAGAASTSASDRELARKHQEFETFAQGRVQQFNKNHRFSKSRMQVVKQGDGIYLARFHKIDDASVKVKVRRSSSRSAPYVAVMSYHERVYESRSETPSEFNGLFDVVKIIPNRHIFSYQKGTWK